MATVSRHAAQGGDLTVGLADRWGIGGLPAVICIAPPGARPACSHWQIRSGERRHVIRFAVPRIGAWTVTVQTAYRQRFATIVWVSHPGPIRLLAAGDSEMQILDDFLAQDLAPYGVAVTSDARISTGLTNTFFFNWQAEARFRAATLHPDVTVMFLGANDGFSVAGPGGRTAMCCGPAWSAGYANLAAEMMTTFLRGQAGRAYWFTLPTPLPANFQGVFDAVNGGIHQAAGRFPGRVALVDANAFFTPGNRYRDYMTYHQQGFVIHESDGIHLSTASDQVAAGLVVGQLLADRVIR